MKTFVVLIPAEGSLVEPRNVCEFLEGTKYDIGGSVQATSTDVLKEVLSEFDLNDSDGIGVHSLSTFMDMLNNDEFDLNDYYFSYVYA
jgi:hypothetical protein